MYACVCMCMCGWVYVDGWMDVCMHVYVCFVFGCRYIDGWVYVYCTCVRERDDYPNVAWCPKKA
jgi:hypothetical protein